jgi:hypothetical protein
MAAHLMQSAHQVNGGVMVEALPVIASEAKQSRSHACGLWIASSLRSSQ